MIIYKYCCDHKPCRSETEDPQGWWIVRYFAGIIQLTKFNPQTYKNGLPDDQKIYCGQDCGTKALSAWMSGVPHAPQNGPL